MLRSLFPARTSRALPFLVGTITARLAAVLLAVAGIALIAAPVHAQQFVVDDAGITDPGACQLEGWLSESAGWILPACSPFSFLELTAGIGFVDEPHGDHVHQHTEYLVQGKLSVLPDDPGALGAGLVVGFGFGPFAQATGVPIEGFYAYVPLTYTLPNERAFLHLNGGWSYAVESELHRAIYGARTDLVLHERVAVIGEVFGEGPDLGLQGGLRIAVVPDLFHVDASYGTALRGDTPDIGFAVGVALTPRPFFRPIW